MLSGTSDCAAVDDGEATAADLLDRFFVVFFAAFLVTFFAAFLVVFAAAFLSLIHI